MPDPTVADLPEGTKIDVHCRICGHKTPINVAGLRARSPTTTLERVKERARCEACGSNQNKRPGMVLVEIG